MANFISTYTPKQASTDKGVAYLWRLSSESGTARGDHKKRLRLTRVLVRERLYAERRAVIGADRPPPVLIRVLHVGRALWCAPRRTASPTLACFTGVADLHQFWIVLASMLRISGPPGLGRSSEWVLLVSMTINVVDPPGEPVTGP
jgi:hypothetical protein